MKISVVIVLLFFVSSCAGKDVAHEVGQELGRHGGAALSCAADAEYSGILDYPIRLSHGKWEGSPFVPGGASKPRAGLMRNFYLSGDLDHDGHDETVVILYENSGGSGTFYYVAVLKMQGNACRNIAVDFIGDRVRVEGGGIEHSIIALDVVSAGPEDPVCCPSMKQVIKWRFIHGRLIREETAARGRPE